MHHWWTNLVFWNVVLGLCSLMAIQLSFFSKLPNERAWARLIASLCLPGTLVLTAALAGIKGLPLLIVAAALWAVPILILLAIYPVEGKLLLLFWTMAALGAIAALLQIPKVGIALAAITPLLGWLVWTLWRSRNNRPPARIIRNF